MSRENQNYESNLLKMVINQELDQIVVTDEDALISLESNIDSTVWKLATKIYQSSGHKVDLLTVKELMISKINSIKQNIYYQKQKEREIRENQQNLVKVEQTRVFNDDLKDEIADVLDICHGNEDKALVFLRVQKVIIEQLEVEKGCVNWDSHIANDLGADECDIIELFMTLEEEFDIEIPEDILDRTPESRYGENTDNKLTYHSSSSNSSNVGGIIGFLGFLGSISSSYNSYVPVACKACKVGELVEFIYEKLSSDN